MTKRKCPKCGKERQYWHGDQCSACWYAGMYQFTKTQDPDWCDWEWAVCEECGSWLSSDGLCHNTSCGASPFLGENWE